MRLTDLLEGLPYTYSGSTDVEITDLIYDSRKVKKDVHLFAFVVHRLTATTLLSRRWMLVPRQLLYSVK